MNRPKLTERVGKLLVALMAGTCSDSLAAQTNPTAPKGHDGGKTSEVHSIANDTRVKGGSVVSSH